MGKRDRDEDDRDHRRSSKKSARSRSRDRDRKHDAGEPESMAPSVPDEEESLVAKRLKRLAAWKAQQDTSSDSAAPAKASEAPKASAPAAPAPAPKKGTGFKPAAVAKPGGGLKAKSFSFGGGAKPAAGGLMGSKAKGPMKPMMGAFATEEDDAPKRGPPGGTFSPPASPEAGSPRGLSDIDSEVEDPLDAFMMGINTEVEESGVMIGAGAMSSHRKKTKEEQEKLKTISWDEIQRMGKEEAKKEEANGENGKEGDGEDDEDEDDSFRQAFIDAIKSQQEERDRKEAEEKQRIEEIEQKARERVEEKTQSGRFDEDKEDDYWVDVEEEEAKYLEMLKKKKLSKELPPVDHDKIDYEDFEKNLYIESQEVKKMTDEEVEALRKEMDTTRVKGRDPPRPLKNWNQTGLSNALLKALQKHGMSKPFAIQAQALPVIMSGRDVIGVAKTGSGKTLAFVLPMLRQVQAQRPLEDGDGPIGLIMAPTRELATQIHTEVAKFTKAMDLYSVCAYGGAPISEQVAALKAGAHVIVATPGRLVDLLCLNNGRVTNLTRCTYLVLDEADRMFDMGFEPQVLKVVNNIRPDRQTVLFSATFPKIVEKHAKNILTDHVLIICGGGVSVVSDKIDQHIEIVDEHAKIVRLLELLKEWYSKGSILIFVDRQDEADELFRDLLKNGYPALTLHGGKDQSDRDNTIADFKNGDNTLLIATSVAARGLDVKDLVLVVNHSCPNHYEDYVHRVGRTGRAGRDGTAYTFITPEDDQYAGDMCKALQYANLEVPEDLKALSNRFERRLKEQEALGIKVWRPSTGYKGKGYKFDEKEGALDQAGKEQRRRDAGQIVAYKSESEEDEEEPLTTENKTSLVPTDSGAPAVDKSFQLQMATMAAAAAKKQNENVAAALMKATQIGQPALPAAPKVEAPPVPVYVPVIAGPGAQNPAIAAALARAAALAQRINVEAATRTPAVDPLLAAKQIADGLSGAAGVDEVPAHFQAELEINDYPQTARWKCTHKDSMAPIIEFHEVCITTRGSWYAAGRNAPPGERKLYLLIEGADEKKVAAAKREVRRMLEETAAGVKEPTSFGRYSV